MKVKKIRTRIIHPSAAFSMKLSNLYYTDLSKPNVGDLVYGQVTSIGQHSSIENKSGRIHSIYTGSYGVFVLGNRYAPDYFEGTVPNTLFEGDEIDLLARSGLVGIVNIKNETIKEPTKIKIIGSVCDKEGRVMNTLEHSLISPKTIEKKKPRAKMILVCGTSMNSGKSHAASSICWMLNSAGYNVRASKVTGTASLKDILSMNDSGAEYYSDFTHVGYPSTYLLDEKDLIKIFNLTDLKYGNNPKKYWVVELADGIMQRETAILLNSEEVKSRIHKLIFCAYDAFGALGGLKMLEEEFNLKPDLLSGVMTASPLQLKELENHTDVPILNSTKPNMKMLEKIV